MEKIILSHGADPHGDLEAMNIYADYIKEQKPNISFLTGDLIHRTFTKEQLESASKISEIYGEKQGALVNAVAEEAKAIGKEKMNGIFPFSLFEAVREDSLVEESIIETPYENKEEKAPSTKDLHDLIKPATPQKILNPIKEYLDAREKFNEHMGERVKIGEQSMELQYKEIGKILEDTTCLVIPGNYDGKCLEKIMPERNMHGKKSRIIEGIKIAGFGSAANGMPWWLPEELLEEFRPVTVKNEKTEQLLYKGSEAGWFMIREDPDIAVLHETPLTDQGLSIYMQNEQPYIILAGHLHEVLQPKKLNTKTRLIMPGKLGTIPTLEEDLIEEQNATELTKAAKSGFRYLRTFVEVHLQKEGEGENIILQPERISYKQIKNGKVEPLMEFKYDKEGQFEGLNIQDKKTYESLVPGGM